MKRLAAIGLFLALSIAALHAPPARAMLQADDRLAQVLSPSRGATVRGDSVTIRVQLEPGTKVMSARLGRHSIADRLERRAGGRLLVTRLRVGRTKGLRHGIDHLVVIVRKGARADTEVVPFAMVRREPRLLRVKAPRRTARAVRLRLRLARPGAKVSVRLDGRRVRLPRSANAHRRTRDILLSGDEGLRHGPNVLEVTAADRRAGRFAVRRRRVVVRRTAPIPGAGLGRRVSLGRRVRLDAGATSAARAPKTLRYRWRLVRKPRGSRAKLRAANRPRPRFKPDRPGSYRLRMTVTELMPTPAKARPIPTAAKRSTGAQRLPLTATPVSASDTTVVTAAPESNGIGLPIDTLESTPGGVGIRVGDQLYLPPNPSRPLQLLVLNRATLEEVSNTSYAGNPEGTRNLAAAVSALTGKQIVVIATPQLGASPPISGSAALANLNRAIATIGGTAIPASAAESTRSCTEPGGICGGFSAIGSPGLPVGTGAVNPGLGRLHGPGGALQGYLQLDQNGSLHTFVDGDRIHFDTTAAATTQQKAAIEVGGAVHESQELAAPHQGAYVLVLDAGTLAFREDATFSLQGGQPSTIATNLQQMAEMLERYESDRSALVFVQSIGTMVRWEAYEGLTSLPYWWNRVASALQELGGERMLFNALEYQTYAQVGPAGPSASEWTKVASQAASRTRGQLAGTLARNNAGQFYPDNATPMSEFDDELTLLAFQPPQPWPLHDTPGHVAAQKCVAAELELPYPVESEYVNENLSSGWSGLKGTLEGLRYDELPASKCETSEFDEAEFTEVTEQLAKEFTYLPVVWELVKNLRKPFELASGSSGYRIKLIGDEVREAVKPPQGPARYDGLDIVQEILYMISAIPGIGEGATGLELIAGGIGLVEATTLDQDGTPELAAPTTTEVDEVAGEIADQYAAAAQHFSQIGEMLVEDWSKLHAAYEGAVGPWEWTSPRELRVIEGLEFAARRFAYTVFFPKAYGGLLRGTRGESSLEITGDASRYPCWQYGRFGRHHTFYPFGKAAPLGGFTPVVEAGPVRENWVFAKPTPPNEGNWDEGNEIYPDFSPTLPGGALLRQLFLEVDPRAQIPLFQQLEFVLAIKEQLKVLTVWHATGENAGNLEKEFNLCGGTLGGWPAGL